MTIKKILEFMFFEKRLTKRWTDKRMDERTDGRKISPFSRTSSPIGAAALPPPMKTKDKVEQGKGTADHLMPLGYLFGAVVGAPRAPDRELTPPRCG